VRGLVNQSQNNGRETEDLKGSLLDLAFEWEENLAELNIDGAYFLPKEAMISYLRPYQF